MGYSGYFPGPETDTVQRQPYQRTKWDDGKIEDMVGRVFASVTGDCGGDELKFTETSGKQWVFRHVQDCCEGVYLEDICGDLRDLVGWPLLEASETTSDGPEGYESSTWTFYRFATVKGTVTVRWLGTSNGYYSESVDLVTTDGMEWIHP